MTLLNLSKASYQRTVWRVVLCCMVVWCLAGCGQPQASGPPLKVVATLAPIADWARQIGQGRVSVTQLVPVNVDPYTYTPSSRDLEALAEADVLLYNGLNVEPWLEEAVPESKVQQLVILELAQFFGNSGRTAPARPLSEQQDRLEGVESARPETNSGAPRVIAPYVWLDPGPNMAQYAVQLIADTFTRADPDHLLTYRRNAERYNGELEVLDGWVRREVRSWPRVRVGTRNVLVMQVPDRSWFYFAQRYGITLRTYVVKEAAGLALSAELPVFADQFADPSEQLRALGLRQPDAVLKPFGDDNYVQLIRSNVAAIAKGMQRAARKDVLPSRRIYDGL